LSNDLHRRSHHDVADGHGDGHRDECRCLLVGCVRLHGLLALENEPAGATQLGHRIAPEALRPGSYCRLPDSIETSVTYDGLNDIVRTIQTARSNEITQCHRARATLDIPTHFTWFCGRWGNRAFGHALDRKLN
jgi:hypothetical protein